MSACQVKTIVWGRPDPSPPLPPFTPALPSNQERSCPLLPTAPPQPSEERGVISMGHCPDNGPQLPLQRRDKAPGAAHASFPR